jgi:hypothetical protein
MSFGYTMNRHGGGAVLNERGQPGRRGVQRGLRCHSDAYGTWA